MNPLLKKEIRLLLPSWIVAMLLALPPICTRSDDGIPVFLLFLGMAMMALTSIGREASLNTFSSLLAQPAERIRIWRTKLSVLIAAFIVVFAVWRLAIAFSFKDYGGSVADPEASAAVLIAGNLILVATFTGGLWSTLLLRQIAGAFWLTLLVPATLCGFTAAFLAESQPDNGVIAVLCVVLGIYSVGGFLFARWLFFRAQDVGWTGGIIALPQLKWFAAGSNAADSPRKRQPIFALLKKEFQLQHVSLLGAAGLLVLHLGVIALRTHHKFARNSAGEVLTGIFWMLWLVLPVIIGAMAVAEERRLGVMEGQLCLPVSRRLQFAIKGVLALFLGAVLGGVLPMFLETVSHNQVLNFAGQPGTFEIVSMQMFIVGLAAWLALVSFFASTLARNFLQAIGYAIASFIGTVMLGSALINGRMFFLDSIPAHSILTVLIAVPTAIVALLWLGYLNYKNFRDGWPLWRRNLLGVAGAWVFIILTSAALYNRAWEVFQPAEPAHGLAIFSWEHRPSLSCDNYENLGVRLPDGRIWSDYLDYGHRYDESSSKLKRIFLFAIYPLPDLAGRAHFVAGSNWVAAPVLHVDTLVNYREPISAPGNHVVGYMDTVGVQADGTLWISDASKTGEWTGNQMNRFGAETNWQQVIRARNSVLLLKTDGTLWSWRFGTNRMDRSDWQTNWPTLHDSQPQPIGTDADWKDICLAGWLPLAQKTNGQVWETGFNDKTGEYEFNQQLRLSGLDHARLLTLSFSGSGERACVRPDGTLWMSWEFNQTPTNRGYADFVQVGTGTDWAAVVLTGGRMVALKTDGSLWDWHFSGNYTPETMLLAAQQKPARLGIHNDWMAITKTWGTVVALAADGSLWLWPDREQYEQDMLLKLPKQPKSLGNVFGKAD